MRDHSAFARTDSKTQDNLLFRPLAQEILAKFVRYILDTSNVAPTASVEDLAKALSIIGKINWNSNSTPWKNILVVPYVKGGEESWKMRSEDRIPASDLAYSILCYIFYSTLPGKNHDWDSIKSKVKEIFVFSPLCTDNDKYFEEWWVEFLEEISKISKND